MQTYSLWKNWLEKKNSPSDMHALNVSYGLTQAELACRKVKLSQQTHRANSKG